MAPNLAVGLDKSKFEIDYFYTAAADEERKKILEHSGVNLIPVNSKGQKHYRGEWVDSDLFEKFDESRYDIIQTAVAGEREWPFYLLKKPVVHSIHLDDGVDLSDNVCHNFVLCEWMRDKWSGMGGIRELSSAAPIGCELPCATGNLREELKINPDVVVCGFHQTTDGEAFSPIPLACFAAIKNSNRCHFLILGGSGKYSEQAKALGLKNFTQLEHASSKVRVSEFLNTLDIFSHGRKDGETFGYVFVDALLHGVPCLSHRTKTSNAQQQTMGPGGIFAKNRREYRAALQRLIDDGAMREKMAAEGLKYAREKFIDTDYFRHIEDVYFNVVNRRQIFYKIHKKNWVKSRAKVFRHKLMKFFKMM